MKLNIHIISHPIIQYLSSASKENNIQINIKKQILKQLGLFLSYETIRNWLQTYNLTVQTVNETKNITLINPKESYTIIANKLEDFNLIQELQYLLPKCQFSFIPTNMTKNINSLCIKKQINNWTKVIIISYSIELEYVKELLQELIKQKIKIHQIRLSCINCHTDQLIQLSNIYPSLNIYTTEIKTKI